MHIMVQSKVASQSPNLPQDPGLAPVEETQGNGDDSNPSTPKLSETTTTNPIDLPSKIDVENKKLSSEKIELSEEEIELKSNILEAVRNDEMAAAVKMLKEADCEVAAKILLGTVETDDADNMASVLENIIQEGDLRSAAKIFLSANAIHPSMTQDILDSSRLQERKSEITQKMTSVSRQQTALKWTIKIVRCILATATFLVLFALCLLLVITFAPIGPGNDLRGLIEFPALAFKEIAGV
ncbi:MAG: hypothetical protein LBI69_02265 [Puniceicoccales bacterium]|jgi:hypothetical protein|nr:hypothetical protein [Puniceicoccales bacterium]